MARGIRNTPDKNILRSFAEYMTEGDRNMMLETWRAGMNAGIVVRAPNQKPEERQKGDPMLYVEQPDYATRGAFLKMGLDYGMVKPSDLLQAPPGGDMDELTNPEVFVKRVTNNWAKLRKSGDKMMAAAREASEENEKEERFSEAVVVKGDG